METETQEKPAIDFTASCLELSTCVQEGRAVAKQAEEILESIANQVRDVNAFRSDLRTRVEKTRRQAYTLLQSISDAVSAEAQTLRKGRKSIALDRLDFLDPNSYIWTTQYGDPVWWLVFRPASNNPDRNAYHYGLKPRSFSKGLTGPCLPFDVQRLAAMMAQNYYQGTLEAITKVGGIQRIYGSQLRQMRAFTRDQFSFAVPTAQQLEEIFNIMQEPFPGVILEPMQ